jgi:hypothetical protein
MKSKETCKWKKIRFEDFIIFYDVMCTPDMEFLHISPTGYRIIMKCPHCKNTIEEVKDE